MLPSLPPNLSDQGLSIDFNPLSRITSFQTIKEDHGEATDIKCSNPLSRITSFQTMQAMYGRVARAPFQSPFEDYVLPDK